MATEPYCVTYVGTLQPVGLSGSTSESETGTTLLDQKHLLAGLRKAVSSDQTTRASSDDDIVVWGRLEDIW